MEAELDAVEHELVPRQPHELKVSSALINSTYGKQVVEPMMSEWRDVKRRCTETRAACVEVLQEACREADAPKKEIVSARVKDRSSVKEKLFRKPKYEHLLDLPDLVGARVVVRSAQDCLPMCAVLRRQFQRSNRFKYLGTEIERPPGADQFGYRCYHMAVLDSKNNVNVEVQVRGLLWHSWANASHSIGYKSDLTHEQRRKLCGVAATFDMAEDALETLRVDVERSEPNAETPDAEQNQGFWDSKTGKKFVNAVADLADLDASVDGNEVVGEIAAEFAECRQQYKLDGVAANQLCSLLCHEPNKVWTKDILETIDNDGPGQAVRVMFFRQFSRGKSVASFQGRVRLDNGSFERADIEALLNSKYIEDEIIASSIESAASQLDAAVVGEDAAGQGAEDSEAGDVVDDVDFDSGGSSGGNDVDKNNNNNDDINNADADNDASRTETGGAGSDTDEGEDGGIAVGHRHKRRKMNVIDSSQ